MVFKIIMLLLVSAWAASNLYVVHLMSTKKMYNEFINGQCKVGAVFTNLFYLPAWALHFMSKLIANEEVHKASFADRLIGGSYKRIGADNKLCFIVKLGCTSEELSAFGFTEDEVKSARTTFKNSKINI